MTSTSMTPASRPRRAVVAALAVAAGAAVVAALVVAGPADEAAAGELEAFSSCEELSEWGALSQHGVGTGEERFDAVAGEVGSEAASRELQSADEASAASGSGGGSAPASTTAPAFGDDDAGSAEEGGGSAEGTDGDTTNVAVEGVDELDVVDRLGTDLYLVTTAERLAIVDLAAAEVRASVAVPSDAQVTYDRDRGVAWVVGHGAEGGVVVERVAVGASDLTSDARWTTSGHLVDARRVGASLHLVATEGFPVAVPGGPEPVPGPAVDGPPLTGTIVEEDVVEDPAVEPGSEGGATEPAPSDGAPTETTLPAAATTSPSPDTTEPEPTEPETTEPETTDPAEPATTEPETTEPVEPDPTVPFPEGPVPCDEVLHPIGPSSPEATLLVTLPATGDLEPTHAAEVVGAGSQVHVTLGAAYLATALHEGEPATSIHRFDLDTLTHTGSGRVEGGLLDEFSMSEHDGHLRVAVTTGWDTFGGGTEAVGAPPVAIEGDTPVAAEEPEADDQASTTTVAEPPGRNEVVVLDTEGDLDVVGRTARFGKPGESIHGIRFTGDVAYAVTFLETDPFYVVDLSDPAVPEVVGEVELPGFSAYLHPLSPSLVVGFGPGEGGAMAKLFDVSDPTAPRVADSVVLGNESAVVWDHHAFVDLGDGRFAVPATTWTDRTANEVVVLDGSDGTLEEVERVGSDAGFEPAQRALPTADGWALLVWDRIEVLDGAGGSAATIPLR